MEGLGINIGYLIIQILGIIILLAFLKAFLYEPIFRTLEARQARIAKGLEDARQAAIARDNADAEAKKILDAARAEAARVRQAAAEQGEETRKSIIRRAEEEARAIVAESREAAQEERDRVLSDLRSQVVAIALAATNKLVRSDLNEAKQREHVDEFLAAPPAGISSLQGDRAVVTSALPLTDDERRRIQRSLNVTDVTFRVDPEILGGLIVRVGDQVVDNSVANQLDELRESLG